MVDIHSILRILNCAALDSFVENVLADVFPCDPITSQKATVSEHLAAHSIGFSGSDVFYILPVPAQVHYLKGLE
jgi:hypothetical protein